MMNLDDDINNIKNSEGKLSLTPKGALLLSMMQNKNFLKYFKKHNDIAIVMDTVDEIWNQFENMARKKYGNGEYIASILFNKNGGIFESLNFDRESEFDKDDDEF